MLRPKEYLYFYRILNWENKISGIRPIGYTFFGYLMAGRLDFFIIFLNSLVIFGVLSFWYSLNDYFDWKIQNEKNFLATKIKKNELNQRQALIYCFLPLILSLLLFLIIKPDNLYPLFLFLVIFFLTTFYSAPPLRLKQKRFLGFLVPMVGAPILFLQGYVVLGPLTISILLLAIILLLFQGYLEMLHIIEDYQAVGEPKKLPLNRAIDFLRYFSLASFMLSSFFILINPFFAVSTIFSLVRFMSLKKFAVKYVHTIRRNLFSLSFSLYEFGIYGLFGILRIF